MVSHTRLGYLFHMLKNGYIVPPLSHCSIHCVVTFVTLFSCWHIVTLFSYCYTVLILLHCSHSVTLLHSLRTLFSNRYVVTFVTLVDSLNCYIRYIVPFVIVLHSLQCSHSLILFCSLYFESVSADISRNGTIDVAIKMWRWHPEIKESLIWVRLI